jgi:DtxR family Mn-dependent transcriptional regulator
MFFVEIMGFGWEEVHDIAEELEHIKSQKLFDRMDELLGFPSVDPHGSPIPDKQGNIATHGYTVLSKTHINSKVKLRAVRNTSKDLLIYLNKKGLSLGTTIHLHDIEPFDRSAIISYNNKNEVVISHEVVKCLLVESN